MQPEHLCTKKSWTLIFPHIHNPKDPSKSGYRLPMCKCIIHYLTTSQLRLTTWVI